MLMPLSEAAQLWPVCLSEADRSIRGNIRDDSRCGPEEPYLPENCGGGVTAWCRPAQHLIHGLGLPPQAALTCHFPCLAEHPRLPTLESRCLISPGEPAPESRLFALPLWRAGRGGRTGSNSGAVTTPG